ncbi:MAG: sialidase family protein, partial [Leptolyngbyaceae cyanobacterium bins.59]|nr:sialidase family protein [Leptolyngbyaceae cyanobacterium bins.59]
CKLADGKPLPTAWANSISPWVTPFILAADRAAAKGKTFYYFDGWTFYISQDGGQTWQRGATTGLPQWFVQPAIVPNPLRSGDIWMTFARNGDGVQRNKLYRSMDGGKTFQAIKTVDSAEAITFGKGASPQTPSLYLFGRIGGAKQDAIYKSDDLAQTWQRISNPTEQQFPGLLMMEGDMRTANLVYVSLGGRGIMVGERK